MEIAVTNTEAILKCLYLMSRAKYLTCHYLTQPVYVCMCVFCVLLSTRFWLPDSTADVTGRGSGGPGSGGRT